MQYETNSSIPVTLAPAIYQQSCLKFNQSDPFHIGDRYGGIPLNLLTNLIGYVILLILFLLIRKNAVRNMGLKLASETIDTLDAVTTQWTQIFFKRDKIGLEDSVETITTIVEDEKTEADQNAASIETEDESISSIRRTSYARDAKFITLKE